MYCQRFLSATTCTYSLEEGVAPWLVHWCLNDRVSVRLWQVDTNNHPFKIILSYTSMWIACANHILYAQMFLLSKTILLVRHWNHHQPISKAWQRRSRRSRQGRARLSMTRLRLGSSVFCGAGKLTLCRLFSMIPIYQRMSIYVCVCMFTFCVYMHAYIHWIIELYVILCYMNLNDVIL